MSVAYESFISRYIQVCQQWGSRPAVIEGGQTACTHSELIERAASLAAEIQAGPEQVVGICLPKSAAYIQSLLAVWMSGAAFLPLDPELPGARLSRMIGQAGVRKIIAGDGIELPGGCQVEIIPASRPGAPADPGRAYRALADSLAYVIFTSGSTGEPKGVAVSHRGIMPFIDAQVETFALTQASRALFYLSTNFDASLSDIGTALIAGAALCIEPAAALLPGPDFYKLIERRGITHMDIPPALLSLLDPGKMPDCLETVVIGGEVCAPHVVRAWASRFRVVNVYGPTEATVCTSMAVCDPLTWERPLIGRPVAGNFYRILDENLQPVPGQSAGELFIGGTGLARGYINRPHLDAWKFVSVDGERLYRTGDRVIEHENGEIEFVGRLDRQFKLRGMLVEPEEIESRLQEHPAVARATVIKRRAGPGSDREVLVAFLVPAAGQHADSRELQRHLCQWLPRWMVPQRFHTLESMPQTATGKADLSALAAMPLPPVASGRQAAPVDRRAQILIECWRQVLAADNIGPDDDFFDMGGDSFAAIEAIVLAESRGVAVPPGLIMSHGSVRAIIEELAAAEQEPAAGERATGAMPADDLRRLVLDEPGWQERLAQAASRPRACPCAPQNILFTGATGFLGARLLVELLSESTATVYCLVRAADSKRAFSRIREAVEKQGLCLEDADARRIVAVAADLSQRRAGLPADMWEHLAATVDTIYHLAATVHNLQPYASLKQANVEGTREVIEIACAGRAKRLHFASTLSVFVASDRNQGTCYESDDLSATRLVWGGYAQSKWAAEVLVRQSAAAVPSVIYRLGLITGDSQTGVAADSDFLSLFIRGLARLKAVPAGCQDIFIDITPVDYAARMMAAISLDGEACQRQDTFHIANRVSLALSDLVRVIRQCGVAVAELPPAAFAEALDASIAGGLHPAAAAACLAMCRNTRGGQSYAGMRTMDLFQATAVRFDTSNTDAVASAKGIICPPPSDGLIRSYARFALASSPALGIP